MSSIHFAPSVHGKMQKWHHDASNSTNPFTRWVCKRRELSWRRFETLSDGHPVVASLLFSESATHAAFHTVGALRRREFDVLSIGHLSHELKEKAIGRTRLWALAVIWSDIFVTAASIANGSMFLKSVATKISQLNPDIARSLLADHFLSFQNLSISLAAGFVAATLFLKSIRNGLDNHIEDVRINY